MDEDPVVSGMPARLGGRICLDFVNTVEPRSSEDRVDYLRSYRDLVRWSEYAGIVDSVSARKLLSEAARRPGAASATFAWAMTARDALYLVFAAVAAERAPYAQDLDTLNMVLAEALPHGRVVPSEAGFAWSWQDRGDRLDCMIWQIAYSALELLTSDEIRRVKDCGQNGGCGWLFLDTTKNGSRRWCSMQVCGSHEKVKRRAHARPRHSTAPGN